jgi:hypothetical protein
MLIRLRQGRYRCHKPLLIIFAAEH